MLKSGAVQPNYTDALTAYSLGQNLLESGTLQTMQSVARDAYGGESFYDKLAAATSASHLDTTIKCVLAGHNQSCMRRLACV